METPGKRRLGMKVSREDTRMTMDAFLNNSRLFVSIRGYRIPKNPTVLPVT